MNPKDPTAQPALAFERWKRSLHVLNAGVERVLHRPLVARDATVAHEAFALSAADLMDAHS
jgi:hypothetical protein